MLGFDFSRFSWWRLLVGVAAGAGMAYAIHARYGSRWSWLAVPVIALIAGFYLDAQGGWGGDAGDGDGSGDGGGGDSDGD